MLLRGLGKFVAVVLGAGLAGALIGIGLSKLSGDDATSSSILPTSTGGAATTTTKRTQTVARTTTPTGATTTSTPASPTTTSTTPAKTVYRVPRVQVLSAQLGKVDSATGRALVAVRARVTNRGKGPLTVKTPVLVSGADEAPLGAAARNAAGPLLKPIAPGASATGVLHFTVTSVVAQRLTATPGARLRLASHTVTVKLTPAP
jgi:hypothetical protein